LLFFKFLFDSLLDSFNLGFHLLLLLGIKRSLVYDGTAEPFVFEMAGADKEEVLLKHEYIEDPVKACD
jgi:hypothetical protein